jgi:hypothetical protein
MYCFNHNRLKFNTKDYLLNAIICQVAAFVDGESITIDAIRDKIIVYRKLDYTFPLLKQGLFSEDLIETVQNIDLDLFMDCVYDYDNVTKLDSWQIE